MPLKKSVSTKSKRVIREIENVDKIFYCRVCMQIKSDISFYDAFNTFLDKNGKCSVCKSCMEEIYQNFFKSERSIERALYSFCRELDICYNEVAVESAIKSMTTSTENEKTLNTVSGNYIKTLLGIIKYKKNITILTFQPTSIPVNVGEENLEEDDDDLKIFWGEGFNYEDYVWLEKNLDEWKKTHKSDTKAEETLLKYICLKELEIRKKQIEGLAYNNLVKELQDLMKTAAIDGTKAMASGGKSQDTFSNFVKVIEENEPAEYYEDKKLYKDYDNMEWYFEKFITRPLKNFISKTRDFKLDDEVEDDTFNIGK